MSTIAKESSIKAVWLDCDPGHDDAIAILLAFYGGKEDETRSLDVLGISTTHGNATGFDTYTNAIKLLSAYGIKPEQCKVWRGSDEPILRKGKVDKGIHGNDGLGGVECLPEMQDEKVQEHIQSTSKGDLEENGIPFANPLGLVQYQISILEERRRKGLSPISLIATGPLTNIALLIKLCPGNGSLLTETIEEIVIMGGSAGMSGNRSPLAEWNINVDPEAASIVFDSKLKVVMAGLNVTHQAILTPSLHNSLLKNNIPQYSSSSISPIRKLVSSAIAFFAETYSTEFGFINGPPIHDVLTVAYVLDPTLFFSLEPRFNTPQLIMMENIQSNHHHPKKVPSKRFRVKIDTSPSDTTAGTTIVDFYQQWPIEHDGWHAGGRNAIVLEYVDTQRLWKLLFEAVDRAEKVLSESH
jgi:inosine-uridine nucleoside N-ribohydrolase